MKNGTDKPLGFYIRDGTSVRLHANGVEKVPGIFISRLVPGGLAESTGLLAVNDEVLEVNGIEVLGKTLDQVTDMMVANSSNLIVTVKPANQRNNIQNKRDTIGRQSQKSMTSLQSAGTPSVMSHDSDDVREIEEQDEVKEYDQSASTSGHQTATTSGASTSQQQQQQLRSSVRSRGSYQAGSNRSSGKGSRPSSIAGASTSDDISKSLEDSGRGSPVVTF